MISSASNPSTPAPDAARLAAYAMISAVVAVHAVYAGYWADRLVPTPIELALARDLTGSPLLTLVWPPWTGFLNAIAGVDAALGRRALSIGCATLAILTAYRAIGALAGDRAAAAAASLAFIAFPPATAAWALATPHGLTVLLVTALMALTLGRQEPLRLVMAFACGVLLAVAQPSGILLAGVALIPACAVPRAAHKYTVIIRVAAAAVAAFGLARVRVSALPPTEIDVSRLGHTGLVDGLLYPYALVWACFILSALALRAPGVRARLGAAGCAGSVGAIAGATGWAILVGLGITATPGQELTSFAHLMPLVACGLLPLAVWVRFVMPTVKSLAAWILFPVIMYSGFWLALGPVDLDRFPYAFRGVIASG